MHKTHINALHRPRKINPPYLWQLPFRKLCAMKGPRLVKLCIVATQERSSPLASPDSATASMGSGTRRT